MKNSISLLGGLIIVVVVGYVIWWLASPLFLNRVVDEAFPTTVAEVNTAASQTSTTLPEEIETVPTVEAMPEEPAADPVALRSGSFMDADASHRGEGIATIYQFPDGQLVLRFEEFKVTNGPDLHVLLSPSADPLNEGLGDYIDLGSLKGNSGNQNYPIPESVDINQYNSIVIYCSPFHVNFAAAMLQ